MDSTEQTRLDAIRYNDSGLKKYKQVDFDDAIADYTKAIELDPKLSVAYYNRGTVLYRLGQYNKAINDLMTAVKLDPNNKEFLVGLEACQLALN